MRTEQEIKAQYKKYLDMFASAYHKSERTENMFVALTVMGWVMGKDVNTVEDDILKAVNEYRG